MAECSVEGCSRDLLARGICAAHRYQSTARKWPTLIQKRQPGSPGQFRLARNGYAYAYFPEHPNANKAGQVTEHVLVAVKTLGRPLEEGENVHHINGVRDDNRPENLELWNTTQPAGQRVDDKVRFALEILHLYRPDLLKETP